MKLLHAFVAAILLASTSTAVLAQRTFGSPEDAARALVDAVRAENGHRILEVVGAKAKGWLMTPDEIADRAEWRLFLAAYDKKNEVVKHGENKASLTVGRGRVGIPGADRYARVASGPSTPDAGREEILNRRVGRNELDTIQTMLAIVDAQREYAAEDSDKNGLHDYAARFASLPGKKDGLYWEAGANEPASPLGELVAKAAREGYGEKVKEGKVQPYQGYIFRMLTSQGPQRSGGSYEYVVGGHMFGGFGVLAYPAVYGNTGVKTFVVNHDGVVYEKDLGATTAEQAAKITRYNPDKTWTKAP
jgi:hypothetical protein